MGKCCSCEGEVKLGPWGWNNANDEWSYRPKQGFKQIIITFSGGMGIESIMFKGSHDGDDHSTKFGGNGGRRTVKKIDIDFPSEFLTTISGTYGNRSPSYISTLNFHTNKNQYGPFGTVKSDDESFSANAKGGVITGFHGLCGLYLKAIGVYIEPPCSLENKLNAEIGSSRLPRFLSPPRSAAAIGANGGREWDDGVFAAVKGVHVRLRIDTGVLSAVRFAYLMNDGSDFVSPLHGGDFGGDIHKTTILFCDKDEYLMGIEGSYGAVEGLNMNVITSLSFITNKAKYGAFGAETGTYFTSMNFGDCNRKVVGFHGRSGAYLHAIGLHSEYLRNDTMAKKKGLSFVILF